MTMDLNGKRVVLCGPMRGMPGFGHPTFDAARSAIEGKWRVEDLFSPAHNDRVRHGFFGGCMSGFEDLAALGFDVAAAQADCLRAIEACDVVVMLPGAAVSRGAMAEVRRAHDLKKSVVSWQRLWEGE